MPLLAEAVAQVEEAMRPDTALLSIMAVNNEIGVVQPMKEIGELCRKNKVRGAWSGACGLGGTILEEWSACVVLHVQYSMVGQWWDPCWAAGALACLAASRISIILLLQPCQG
jgi:hypothetical protein